MSGDYAGQVRQLKNYAHAPRLCPVCSPDSWMNQMPGPVQKQTQ